ncbi:MAG: TPM domain-containing protein [Ruminococcus sp.]|nr:TPM domain-containing protein [Ruminococcus sp.]MBQ9515030.1 TPM domain-containing protein [Ruminococcus sp.]
MKMTKRVCSLLFVIAILFVAILPASAQPTSDGRLVVDNAGFYTSDQVLALTELAKTAGEKQKCDIIIYTTRDLEGYSAQSYADYAHIKNYNDASVLLLICDNGVEGDRDYHISTHGDCIKKLKDSEIDEIKEAILPYLKSGNYYDAAKEFIDKSAYYMQPHLKWYMLPLAILIGFVIAMLIMSAIRSKLKTVAMQRGAASYVRSGSMNVTQSRDTYLYSTVSRTRREKSSSGSSTHSTGGDSFGGSGGKF